VSPGCSCLGADGPFGERGGLPGLSENEPADLLGKSFRPSGRRIAYVGGAQGAAPKSHTAARASPLGGRGAEGTPGHSEWCHGWKCGRGVGCENSVRAPEKSAICRQDANFGTPQATVPTESRVTVELQGAGVRLVPVTRTFATVGVSWTVLPLSCASRFHGAPIRIQRRFAMKRTVPRGCSVPM
jgi:hypothetical protein